MIATVVKPVTWSRWLDWSPKTSILADSAGGAPTKPSKPGSVGFVGAISADSPKIQPEPDAAELTRASAVLREAGVRIMQLDGVTTIGIWSDRDGPKVRAALGIYGSDQLPVRYLDGAAVPMRYKLRRVEGEPVPLIVLLEMERSPREPWKVRDRMLQEIGWGSRVGSWAEWKAAQLNRLFQEQGVTGRPGRITAKTIRHGERKSEELARKQSGEPGRLGTRLDVAGGVRLPPDGFSGPPVDREAAACLVPQLRYLEGNFQVNDPKLNTLTTVGRH